MCQVSLGRYFALLQSQLRISFSSLKKNVFLVVPLLPNGAKKSRNNAEKKTVEELTGIFELLLFV